MQRIIKSLPLGSPAIGDHLLWEHATLSRRSPSRDLPIYFNWRAGSNSFAGQGDSALRWRSGDGARYAVLASPHGSVVWMTSTLRASAQAVTISFDARDLAGPECCVPIVYAGRLEPIFPAFFKSDFHTIGTSWRKYSITVELPRHAIYPFGCDDEVVVAIGFANPDSERAEVPTGQAIGIANILINRI